MKNFDKRFHCGTHKKLRLAWKFSRYGSSKNARHHKVLKLKKKFQWLDINQLKTAFCSIVLVANVKIYVHPFWDHEDMSFHLCITISIKRPRPIHRKWSISISIWSRDGRRFIVSCVWLCKFFITLALLNFQSVNIFASRGMHKVWRFGRVTLEDNIFITTPVFYAR